MAVDTKGRVYVDDLTTLSEEEMDSQAEVFAEGSPELKELLLLLWENRVQTKACCAGALIHAITGKNKKAELNGKIVAGCPYISFFIDNIEDDTLKKLIFSLYQEKDVLDHFEIIKNYDDKPNLGGINSDGDIVSFSRSSPVISIYLKPDSTFDECDLYFIVANSFKEDSTFDEQELEPKIKEIVDASLALKNIDFSLLKTKDLEKILPHHILLQGKTTYLRIRNKNEELEYYSEYVINGKPEAYTDKEHFDKTIELAQKYQAEEIELE